MCERECECVCERECVSVCERERESVSERGCVRERERCRLPPAVVARHEHEGVHPLRGLAEQLTKLVNLNTALSQEGTNT